VGEQAEVVKDPLLLTIKVAAAQMGLGTYEVRTLVESGRLPAERIGRAYYIPASAIREYVASIGTGRESA
jgi:excisionase family DNA binding protein